MSEPAVVVASPPRRPPPPSVQKNQEVGVANHKQLKERKDSRDDILIVDSRSKSKSKSKPPFEDTSLTDHHPPASRTRSNTLNSSFTLINSKESSPSLGKDSSIKPASTSAKTSAPPPRPGPPRRQKSMTSVETSSVVVRDGEMASTGDNKKEKKEDSVVHVVRDDEVTSTGDNKKEKKDHLGQENTRTPNHEDRSVRSPPSRPSRPPPPRAKSLPRIKSLTAYKKSRDARERSPSMEVSPVRTVEENAVSNQGVTTPPSPLTPSFPDTSKVEPTIQTAVLVDIGEEQNERGKVGHSKKNERPTRPSRRHSARSTPSPITSPSRNISSPELRLLPSANNLSPTVEHTPTITSTHNVIETHADTPIENITDDFHYEDTISKPVVDNHLNTEDVVTSDPSPPVTNGQPAIPPRPYLPPRPFPPRTSPAHKNQGNHPPPKPKRTRQYPNGARNPSRRLPNQANGTNKEGTHKAHVTSVSHDLTPRSHDPPNQKSNEKYQHAIMMSVEDPMFSFPVDTESIDTANETSSISITGQEVVFDVSADPRPGERLSEGSPDYQTSLPATLDITAGGEGTGDDGRAQTGIDPAVITAPKTLFELNEQQDQVPPLQSSHSSRFQGKKLLNSMKKSFRSLRHSRKHDEGSSEDSGGIRQRTQSDIVLMNREDPSIYPDPLPQGIINPLVVQCVAYLNRDSVLVEQGLFRIPGDVAVIRRLRGNFVSGLEVDLNEILDPHTVCGLLKLHFREQRVSMIPRGQTLTELIHAVKEKDVERVREVINTINVTHIATLRMVTEVLVKVVAHSDENRMTSGTLATSCGLSFFPYLPPSNANQLLKFLLDHCDEIFLQ